MLIHLAFEWRTFSHTGVFLDSLFYFLVPCAVFTSCTYVFPAFVVKDLASDRILWDPITCLPCEFSIETIFKLFKLYTVV